MSFVDIMVFQTKVLGTKEENLNQMAEKMEKADLSSVDLVTFPEMFCCPYETESFPLYAEAEGKCPGSGSPHWQKSTMFICPPEPYLSGERTAGSIIRPTCLTGRGGRSQSIGRFIFLILM